MVFHEAWAKVAVIEDDPAQLTLISQYVRQQGFVCSEFLTPRQFINGYHHDSFDLIVLDLILPEMDGIEVLEHIRKQDSAIPVLVLSCRDDDSEILKGFEAGADDYITKPANPEILMARLRALLKRIAKPSSQNLETYSLGRYTFEPATSSVHFNEREVVLTNREFAVAWLLFTNPHRAFSRHYLLERLWGKAPDNQTRTLDTHIARLRTKLELDRDAGVRLTTLYGYGYRLEPNAEMATA